MRDNDLNKQILGIQTPWTVAEVERSMAARKVTVHVEHTADVRLIYSQCGTPCQGYDPRALSWQYLDTCQFKTLIVATVPRVTCPIQGVENVMVPWAEPRSGFTAL